jgi:CRISPR/Cas system-associated exonuclease Cas4 (RecB family)
MLMERPARAPIPTRDRPPNRLAQDITGRPYLSHSQLSLMRSCPARFCHRYVEKAPADFVASSLLLGGAIHHALEMHYRARLEGLSIGLDALLSAFADGWKRQQEDAGQDVPIRFNKGEDRSTLDALARSMIFTFLASPIASPRGEILGVEEELRVVLDPDLPDIIARVDLVTQTEDGLHVVDFKTSRSRWNQEKAIESADQLVLYGATVERMRQHLGLPVKLHFAILTKARTPIVQVLDIPADSGRLATMRQTVAQLWEAIQTGNFYPSPSPMACTTCPYRSRCSVFGGG